MDHCFWFYLKQKQTLESVPAIGSLVHWLLPALAEIPHPEITRSSMAAMGTAGLADMVAYSPQLVLPSGPLDGSQI